jgi:hypothetical protein
LREFPLRYLGQKDGDQKYWANLFDLNLLDPTSDCPISSLRPAPFRIPHSEIRIRFRLNTPPLHCSAVFLPGQRALDFGAVRLRLDRIEAKRG